MAVTVTTACHNDNGAAGSLVLLPLPLLLLQPTPLLLLLDGLVLPALPRVPPCSRPYAGKTQACAITTDGLDLVALLATCPTSQAAGLSAQRLSLKKRTLGRRRPRLGLWSWQLYPDHLGLGAAMRRDRGWCPTMLEMLELDREA